MYTENRSNINVFISKGCRSGVGNLEENVTFTDIKLSAPFKSIHLEILISYFIIMECDSHSTIGICTWFIFQLFIKVFVSFNFKFLSCQGDIAFERKQ